MTLTVNARYSIRSPRRIALTFQEAVVGDVQISSTFEAFLAPALLPRGWLNHRILLAIQEVGSSQSLSVTCLCQWATRAERVCNFAVPPQSTTAAIIISTGTTVISS